MGVVIISVVAVTLIFIATLLTTSSRSYRPNRCSGAMGRSKLQQRYYDPKRVGSYSSVVALRRVVPEQDVERWFSKQDAYTLHKSVKRRLNATAS